MSKKTKVKEEQAEVTNEATESEAPKPEPDSEDAAQKLKEAQDALLRERAEFQNYRKRTIKEKGDIEQHVTVKILSELLPVLDSFDRVFQVEEGVENENVRRVLDGVELIQKQLLEAFANLDVEEYDPTGEEFDPATMQALSRIESEDVEKDTVDEVYQKGYKVKDRVVRAARVAVKVPAKKQGSEDEDKTDSSENKKQEQGEENE